MAFPPEFIERVRESSDIIEIIGQYVSLKRRGSNYLGLCPFHSEKKPSFTVSPAKGIFYCFGCGAGGNVISFIMQREKMNFVEAVEFLAQRANLEIPREKPRDHSIREKLFQAVKQGHDFFRAEFKKSPVPAEYLRSRNFGREVAEKMELGYAPPGWDNFCRNLKSNLNHYVTVGLIRKRENESGHYDYFRNRLIFPIKDLSGRVCAFGGRYLGEDDDKNAKYLNSPESQIYNKGSLLYALGQNREAVRKEGFVYLVEGYTDLLRLISCGVMNSAAGLGTSFTIGQAKLLRRYTERAALLYDGDEAGSRAALKAGRILSSAGMEVEIIRLPAEHDPDTFLLEFGREGLEKSTRLSLLHFQYRLGGDEAKTRQGREKLAREMLESAAVLPGETKRSLALEEISELLGIPVKALLYELRSLRRGMRDEDESAELKKLSFTANEIVERDLLRVLICNPKNCEEVFPSFAPELITHDSLRSIMETMKSLWLKGELKEASDILNQFDNQEIKNFIAECGLWETTGYDRDLIRDAKKKLSDKAVKAEKTNIQKQIKEAESRGEDISGLLKELKKLSSGDAV